MYLKQMCLPFLLYTVFCATAIEASYHNVRKLVELASLYNGTSTRNSLNHLASLPVDTRVNNSYSTVELVVHGYLADFQDIAFLAKVNT